MVPRPLRIASVAASLVVAPLVWAGCAKQAADPVEPEPVVASAPAEPSPAPAAPPSPPLPPAQTFTAPPHTEHAETPIQPVPVDALPALEVGFHCARVGAPDEPSPADVATHAPLPDGHGFAAPPDGDAAADPETWGRPVQLSMRSPRSLASIQRIRHAIDTFRPLAPQDVDPQELLNAWAYAIVPITAGYDFTVSARLAPSSLDTERLSLVLNVLGRPIDLETRRNVALTLLVDSSASLEGDLLHSLKRGLLRLLRELKEGDLVNVVFFDEQVCSPMKGFVLGRDNSGALTRVIHSLKPRGRANLEAALKVGYEIAESTLQPSYTNVVLLVSDLLSPAGEPPEALHEIVSEHRESTGIRLSAVGLGPDYNDAWVRALSSQGGGSYAYLGSDAYVDPVFGDGFLQLVEPFATEVVATLRLPDSLRAVGLSKTATPAAAAELFAPTSRAFFLELEARAHRVPARDGLMLELEYFEPRTGEAHAESFPFLVDEIYMDRSRYVRKAELSALFARSLADLAGRPPPAGWLPQAGGWNDPKAASRCASTEERLRDVAAGLDGSGAFELLDLWAGYCSRYGSTTAPATARAP